MGYPQKVTGENAYGYAQTGFQVMHCDDVTELYTLNLWQQLLLTVNCGAI